MFLSLDGRKGEKTREEKKATLSFPIAMSFQLLSDFYPFYDEKKRKEKRKENGTRPY